MIKMIYLPEYWILRSDSWTNKDINTFVLDWNQNYTHFCAISPSLMDLILVKLSDEEIQFPLCWWIPFVNFIRKFLLLEAMIGSAPEYYKVETVCSTLVPCLMSQSAGKYRQTTNIQMLHWSWRGCTELKASERENLPSIFFSSLILLLKYK